MNPTRHASWDIKMIKVGAEENETGLRPEPLTHSLYEQPTHDVQISEYFAELLMPSPKSLTLKRYDKA